MNLGAIILTFIGVILSSVVLAQALDKTKVIGRTLIFLSGLAGILTTLAAGMAIGTALSP